MNVDKIRRETRGCSDKIFLNSCGASLMPDIVVDSMREFLSNEEQIGGYAAAERNQDIINVFYNELAKLLNCKAQNIAFTFNATDAYAKALSSVAFQKDDYIITTDDDYVSNHIAFISLSKRFGVKILRVKNCPNNEADLDDLENLIKKHNPKMVAVTHIPTNSGFIQNITDIGKICQKYDILYLVDACQSVGQLTIDVQEIKCDFLTATGRKFLRGPRGTGFLYVSDKVLNTGLTPLFADLRGANWTEFNNFDIEKTAKRFEHWEMPYGSMIGLGQAVRYANTIGLKNITEYNTLLSQTLRKNISQNDRLKLMDKGTNLGSIISFCNNDLTINHIKKILDTNNVFYSISTKNYALIDFTNKNIEAVIRLSPHYFNNMKEIEFISEILNY